MGLLDMDVFGPSIPRMMNLSDSPAMDERKLGTYVFIFIVQ